MDLSVVVPVTRSIDNIYGIIESIERYLPEKLFRSIELILVSEKKLYIAKKELSLTIKELVVKGSHPNIKRNAGIESASNEVIALLDDDVKVTRTWFETIYDEYRRRGYEGILTGPSNLLYSDTFSEKMAVTLICNPLSHLRFTQFNPKREEVRFFEVEFSSCILTKKIWDKIGRLNENIDFYWDDSFPCYKARLLEIPLVNHPGLKIAHKRRAFPLEYFKDHVKQKFHAGKNFVHYPFLYTKNMAVWASWIFLVVSIIIILSGNFKFFLYSLLIYLIIAYPVMLKYSHSVIVGILSPPFLLMDHIFSLLAFYAGVLYGIATKAKYSNVIQAVKDEADSLRRQKSR